MPAPREIELKLEVDPADHRRIARHFGLTTAKRLVSTYYDDPDLGLRNSGLTLRIRSDGKRHVQTIKDTRAAAGLHDRSEWEQPLVGLLPDLGAFAAVVDDGAAVDIDAVAPRFCIDVKRRTAVIDRYGASIELALDAGIATADGGNVPISELELELKSGDPAALFMLAREIDAVAPVRLGVFTKAELGYRLLDRRDPAPAKAANIVLSPDMDAVTAFVAIAGGCLRQFRRNEMLLVATRDAGALHQARVALRRLRSAFSLFGALFDAEPVVASLRDELRWLAGLLGDARNLDVLIEQAGSEHRTRLRQARDASYDQALAALGTPRSRHLMLDLAAWLACLVPGPSTPDIEGFAVEALDRHRRRLKKRSARLVELDDTRRHAVRIEAKKLRYATEFFEGLFKGKRQRRRYKALRDDLEAVQFDLGDLNDRATAPLVWAMLGIDPPPVEPGAPKAKILAHAARTLDELFDRKPFWR